MACAHFLGENMSTLREETRCFDDRARKERVSDDELVTDRGALALFWLKYVNENIDLLELKEAEWILDAGCGAGRYLSRLQDRDVHVVGADASIHMLLRANKRLRKQENTNLVSCDILRLPFREDVFDAILSTSVLAHIPSQKYFRHNKDVITKALHEFKRVLRTKGRILINYANLFYPSEIERLFYDFLRCRILGRSPTRIYPLTLSETLSLYKQMGLAIHKVVAKGFYPPFRFNLLSGLGIKTIIPEKCLVEWLSSFDYVEKLLNKFSIPKHFAAGFVILGEKP